ncbi:MAG: DUF2807 domain-containing protein [Prevotella sp.]|nr:DUF2807 domain-containing protein [Prevotella sp.]
MSKKSIIAISMLLAAVLVGSCTSKSNNAKMSRDKVTLRQKIEPFERIVVDIAGNVTYTQSHSTKLTIYSNNKELANAVKIENEDGTLHLSFDNDKLPSGIDISTSLKVQVSSPDLIGVDLKGAGKFETQGIVDTDTLLIQMEGGGRVNTDRIVCDRFQADLLGAGKMELGPIETQQSEINLRGVGKIDADFTDCDVLNCLIEGVGKIKLTGKVQKWNSKIEGAGKVDVDGLRVTEQ